mmetsp:Transcript_41053/g.64102  ORF Transcript_41053/g.64102 Transcript_41053/m.64102 type:complete len:488 (-) Transcript_41053:147-1610(-)
MGDADIGLVGLAVMGENLVLNIESRGFKVALFNRTVSKVNDFVTGRGKGKNFVGTKSLEELCAALKKPRKVMLMVKAGEVVDQFIEKIVPFLESGDIIIDGGNSHFDDSERRMKALKATEGKEILFIGTGVSGGEEGALIGPSIMPGGSPEAWPAVKPIFQAISAKVEDGSPCCEWVGTGGAGHFVKMVHNGIEYGDMQIICECYHMMKGMIGMSNSDMAKAFGEWNKGDLNSFLVEITADILGYKDEQGVELIDMILDKAGQKGTGKWTGIEALNLGMPLTLIGESVFARCLSALKDDRVAASTVLPGPKDFKFEGDTTSFLEDLRQAMFVAKVVSYAQGYMMIQAAAGEYKWDLKYGDIALMWRGGCIIRSTFLGKIKEAFDKNPDIKCLLLDQFFVEKLGTYIEGLRRIVAAAAVRGIPIPCLSTALSFYDGYRCGRLPANLLQAQRDYFGAHTYERVDKPRGQFEHTNWTGRGGTTASSTYNA